MTRPILSAAWLAMVALSVSGCAPAAKSLRIEPGRTPAVSRLSEIRLPPGTHVVVSLTSGEQIRGRLEGVRPAEVDVLVPRPGAGVNLVTLQEPEIQSVARVVARSKGARTRIGAAIGAAVTLPFGISMVGDMIVPGAIAGAFVGRATGDSRGEIVFERATPIARR
jgi:hypothetical protein